MFFLSTFSGLPFLPFFTAAAAAVAETAEFLPPPRIFAFGFDVVALTGASLSSQR
jgi:hypothetical protein